MINRKPVYLIPRQHTHAHEVKTPLKCVSKPARTILQCDRIPKSRLISNETESGRNITRRRLHCTTEKHLA